MPGNRILEILADAYIPFLGVAFIFIAAVIFFRIPGDRKALGRILVYGLILALIAVGLMLLDDRFRLWQTAGLEYSVGVGVALSLVIPLCLLLNRYQVVVILSFAAYLVLMRYERFYSIPDMLASCLVMALCGFLLFRWLFAN